MPRQVAFRQQIKINTMNSSVTRRSFQLHYEHYGFIVVTLLSLVLIAFPRYSISAISHVTQTFVERFGLSFLLFSSATIFVCLLIAMSPIGNIKLGGQAAKVEFSTFSWITMLFTCGMGSGLVFWGVAEPTSHFAHMPAFGISPADKIDNALALTYFHWGLHAWCIYALAGLTIAWFTFNRGRPLFISSSVNAESKRGLFVTMDWLAIVAILFGVAGTFANTIALIQAGVENIFGVNADSVLFRYSIIFVISICFTGSSLLGLNKGIKRLSQLNIVLLLVMMMFVVMSFDPITILNRVLSSTARYVEILPDVSFSLAPNDEQWSVGWTIIYIVWWIAWAPFVGPFIARISQGRTVRQFILCVALVPSLASVLWFTVFGGTALEQASASLIIDAVDLDYTQGLFLFLDQLQHGSMIACLAIVLLITFIITSADSALLVCGMLDGKTGKRNTMLWAVVLLGLSLSLIYINDVNLNKQVAIAGALPFTFVLIVQIVSMLNDMVKQYQSSTS